MIIPFLKLTIMARKRLNNKIKKIYILSSICGVLLMLTACLRMQGEKYLGNNLFLWVGDKSIDYIIVYNNNKWGKWLGISAGDYIIPYREMAFYQEQEKKQQSEYITAYNFDSTWIIARTNIFVNWSTKTDTCYYWIINKPYVRKIIENDSCLSDVLKPMNKIVFDSMVKVHDIQLKLREI